MIRIETKLDMIDIVTRDLCSTAGESGQKSAPQKNTRTRKCPPYSPAHDWQYIRRHQPRNINIMQQMTQPRQETHGGTHKQQTRDHELNVVTVLVSKMLIEVQHFNNQSSLTADVYRFG
jgi:hypothetical protein